MTGEGESEYYQAIARKFLGLRGAPFFLSPRDLEVIADWEKRRIPLGVVLEGVERAFDGLRDRSRGTRGLSLSFCEAQVVKAMSQHRDRDAGRRSTASPPRSAKKDKVRRELAACLSRLPGEDRDLPPLLEAASAILAQPSPDEDDLERIDGDIDDILWGRSPTSEREEFRVRMQGEFPDRPREEIAAAARTALLRSVRKRWKIPYVSLYYY
jgi:hypothetical protein